MKITIPVSIGELIDKITILEIKKVATKGDEYVTKELDELKRIKSTLTQCTIEYELELKKVNEILWHTELDIREKEKLQEFDNEFIELARRVYKTNDLRSQIKRKINEEFSSEYKEIKVY